MAVEDFITSVEAADALGYTVQHVRRLVRQGKLAGKKLGRDWVVERQGVERLAAARKNLRLPLRISGLRVRHKD